MVSRRVISAVTMVVLLGLLVVGAYVGWRAVSAPFDEEQSTTATEPSHRCNANVSRGDVVRPDEVTVSVFNAGTRSGLAGQTMAELEARGFIPGDLGNAPDALQDVRFVRILAPSKRDPTARLVALQFGPQTFIQPVKKNLGRGVDVIVGNDFVGLVDAPSKIKARASGSGC
jgi:hypothetical protein